MTTRIVDVAHTAAAHRTPAGPHQDLDAARQAVATGLDVDDAAELIHGDRLRLGPQLEPGLSNERCNQGGWGY
ncbi:hypothetical protein [Streptomyces hirsutus]|uniref:hypothetical protein n=1 Tax=Streptomyces hirsutus TaxID=35620 RepID=UPI00332C80E6